MSPQGSAACISCLMFNLHSVDSFDSCSFKTQMLRGHLKHKLLFFRTLIIRIARMSTVGSAACVSCLMFNLHSVDSFDSCSFKTQMLRGHLKHKLLFFRTLIIRIARMSTVGSAACVSCLMFNLHSVDSFDSCSLKHELLFF